MTGEVRASWQSQIVRRQKNARGQSETAHSRMFSKEHIQQSRLVKRMARVCVCMNTKNQSKRLRAIAYK